MSFAPGTPTTSDVGLVSANDIGHKALMPDVSVSADADEQALAALPHDSYITARRANNYFISRYLKNKRLLVNC